MNTQYFFYLYPNVYVSDKKQESILLYNTSTGKQLVSNDRIFNDWVRKVYEPQNLGVIAVCKEEISRCCSSLLAEAISLNIGNVETLRTHKPVNLLPFLSLQKDFEKYDNKGEESMLGDDIISYLSELNLFLTSNSDGDRSFLKYVHQQRPFPVFNEFEEEELDEHAVETILKQISYSPVKNINIFGGDLSLYKRLVLLNDILAQYNRYTFHFWSYVMDIDRLLVYDNSNYCYDIIVIPKYQTNIDSIKQLIEGKLSEVKYRLHVYITSEEEYEEYARSFSHYQIEIRPLFADNLGLFQKNIFINRCDFEDTPVSMRSIFCNQKVNSNFFGQLSIYPNGDVRTTYCAELLGNIYNDKIIQLIHKELVENTSWRKVRSNNVCERCHYQYLCPPPSLYESVIGKKNLCSIVSD